MDEEVAKPCVSLWEKLSNWKIRVAKAYKERPFSYWILLVLSIGGMLVALPTSTLMRRIYIANGGKSKWIISWVAVAGWPITALMLPPAYWFWETFPTPLTLKLVLSYVVLGFLTAAHYLMNAYAYAYLPALTAALLASSLLVFSCLFGYFIVDNKLNSSTINATVLITASTTIIALDLDSERNDNISNGQYIWGFVWNILASILHALIFALSELVFIKLLGRRSFHVVLEQQTMVSLFAFIFTTVGVILNKDFQGMGYQAKTFIGGEASYIKLLVWVAITCQLGALGTTGVVFLDSTVTAGIYNSVRNPITIIAAAAVLHDPMSGIKILSVLLTLWGLCSYIYGNF